MSQEAYGGLKTQIQLFFFFPQDHKFHCVKSEQACNGPRSQPVQVQKLEFQRGWNLARHIFPSAAQSSLFPPSLGRNTWKGYPAGPFSVTSASGGVSWHSATQLSVPQGKGRLKTPNNKNNLLQILGYQKLEGRITAKHLALLRVKGRLL